MFVCCPKCNSCLYDMRGGGILTKCRKCGLNGDLGLEMFCMKNEYEIEKQSQRKAWGRETDI